ncbi:MAG: biopolymer transporter ExbD [Gammaproteobacteria bacterium CG22_combo_CG10-13_8_21_14_all_40_8]|nr:MAG: biopolymer transporter ExbD [Gammaproteobacteria bacterium CG22_combo_CG10-13_8_21_14_all_40_8]
MARRSKQKASEAEIDMTPMLDVVFIMLIFFIVTTSFVRESGQSVNSPIAKTAVAKKNASLFIAVTKNDEVWIAKKKYKPDAVRAQVEKLKHDNPEGSVVIQADIDAKAGIVLQVLDQIKAAGVEDASIAAKGE